MATSRLALVAALATGVDAARIARKRAKDCYSMYDGKKLLTLNACASVQEILVQLKEADCTVLDEPRVEQLGCTDAEVVCSDKGDLLEKAGIATLVSSDAGAFWRGASGVTQAFVDGPGVASDAFYSEWRDLEAINARVKAAVEGSSHATLEVAGQSVEGRDLHIVRIRGRGYTPDKKMPRVFLTFNLHAREWITGMAGVYAVEHMVKKAEQDWSYFDATEVVLMPMANPDGFVWSTTENRLHRKNMGNKSGLCWGVDLNRNFDTHWASGGSSGFECMDTYHGPSAMSEPETKAIAKVMGEAYMSVYIDTHSFTQLVLTSPGWTKSRSARHSEYRNVGGWIQHAMQARHGEVFTEGPTATTLYVATGTTMDYADEAFGALGICLELRPARFPPGGGFNPPPSEILPSAEETFDGILAAIEYAKDPSSPLRPPATTAAPSPPWFFR